MNCVAIAGVEKRGGKVDEWCVLCCCAWSIYNIYKKVEDAAGGGGGGRRRTAGRAAGRD
jgi:hypothetical protein